MNVRQITPAELAGILADEPAALLLDVREEWEHRHASIPGSLLIPLGLLMMRAEEELPDRDRPVIVYCHHGIRSLQACAVLASLGYGNLSNLAGGIHRYSSDVDPSIPVY
ncbi:MAG TPA: rhodanese-like domain-containing protein [Candidatus Kapabacteria bacterium]|nr:rhodanese-like domain-containing protein [Candidatus Kapabacteria bacterium]